MELYQTISDEEERLCEIASRNRVPIGGTMELLPICNMACQMCYVRMSKAEMDAQGRMLTCDEWLRIAEEGRKEGLLYLLLTGGEPLLYPDFRRLYAELMKNGHIICVNTNGTLIDEEWADFFKENGCRRISISIYGKDNDTYGKLCGNPKGFTQVMKAITLLKERNIPIRLTSSITPHNVEQIEDFYKIANQMEVPISLTTHIYPAARRRLDSKEQFRLSPEEEAKAFLRIFRMKNPNVSMEITAQAFLRKLLEPPILQRTDSFTCRAGKSGFWINWKGEMLPCGMFNEPSISLQKHSFRECWDYIVTQAQKAERCNKCLRCPKQNLCLPCLADNYTETGSVKGCPEHLCHVVDRKIELLLQYANIEKN